MKPTADATSSPTPDRLIYIALGLFAFAVIFSVTAVQAALFLTLIALLIKNYRERSLPLLPRAAGAHPLALPWLVYLSVCLLTALTAYYPAKGFNQLNSDFLKYICLFTLLLAVKKEHLPRLSAVFTTAAVISALAGISETALSVLRHEHDLARAGFMMNAVRYGEVMMIALMLPLARLALPGNKVSPRGGALNIAAALLIFTALAFSQTRGAYLGVLAGLLTAFIFVPAARKKLLVLTVAMLAASAALALTTPVLRERVSSMLTVTRWTSGDAHSAAINVRLELWKVGYKMLRAHPALGIGPDNVKKVFKQFHPESFPEEGNYGTLNNLYLHQAAERGLLGLGALFLLFGAFFLFALRNFKRSTSPYALWALCALPAFFVANVTEISFQHVHTSFAIFLALAFSAAAEKETV